MVDDILMNVNGVTDVTMNTVTTEYNKALNGLHFIGAGNGTVQVNDFTFQYNNDDLSIHGDTLVLFDGFTDLNVDTCNAFTNDGDYLFKATLSRDVTFNNCQIDKNDIDDSIIY